MEKEEKRCKKCGSIERVWYEGYCEKCYGEIYRQKQEETKKQETPIPQKTITQQDSPYNLNYSEPLKLGMKWFEFYKRALLFFLIFNCLTSVNNFIYNTIKYNNQIVVLVSFINFSICYQYTIYRDLKNQKEDAVKNLLIFLIISFFIIIISKLITNPYESPAHFMGYFLGVAIIYIPNLIYFYKRRDVYRK